MPASKLLMLQHNHIKDSTIMSSTTATSAVAAATAATTPYVNGQQNGNSKVVLVTNESTEIDHSRNVKTTTSSNNGTDEELTSLTWLHDKNLLKGINISCPPNVKHMNNNNNHLKIVSDNVSVKPQIQQTISAKSVSSGAVTPTSDFVDDSGVSEDNASSVTSGSEHGNSSSSSSISSNGSSSNSSGNGGSIYRNIRTTPKSFATTTVRERDSSIEPIDNDDIDDANNNTINKNRTNSNHQLAPSASSIIQLSPSGGAVIEYKTVSNLPQKSSIIPNTPLSSSSLSLSTSPPTSSLSNISSSAVTNPVIVSAHNGIITNNMTNVIKTVSTQSSSSPSNIQTSTASTPHTHFHKKYIKAMNALNSNGTDTMATPAPNSTPNTNSNQDAQISTPSNIVSVSAPTTIYTIPMKTDFSSAKYEHETVIVENEYPHSAINLVSNANQRIYHGNETDRHSDEYVTPISSPRLQQQQQQQQPPAAPQKLSNTTNISMTQTTPTGITLPQPTVPMPAVSPNSTQNQAKPANSVPYDPFIHTNNKPPLSFSSLIFLAIEDAKEKALPVKEIYAWIVKHYPYFKTAPTGWKNSVRHNLSLNKCFQKVEKAPNMGKGSLWRVEQQYKQNLIIALTRSSYHPNTSAMEKATASLKNTPISPESPPLKSNKRPLDAELFPRLSKFMANMQNGNSVKIPASNNNNVNNTNNNNINNTTEVISSLITDKDYHLHSGTGEYSHSNGESVIVTTNHEHVIHTMHDMDETQRNVERIARDWGVDSIDDVNAATAMLALKHGPKIFSETFQTGTPIITTKPSEDHTYSAGGGGKPGNAVSTIVNIVPNGTNVEPTVHFNGNNTPPFAPHQIQIKPEINSMPNGHEIIIDNRHSDNMSNGTSSDAAYESSDDSHHGITAEEEEARRHQEGVDAFLSFATEVSSMSSPLKRPPSADYVENIPMHNYNNNNHPFANGNATFYYNGSSSPLNQPYGHHQAIYSYMSSSPSPPKKSRTRTLRTKLKKKTWLR